MIYAGIIDFNNAPDRAQEMSSVLGSYTDTSPTVVRNNSLTLCYGKLSNMHDMDEVWENPSSVLIGRIFDKSQQSSFTKDEFKNLSHLNAEETLEKIWGKYIYIKGNKTASQFEIVIDTTGQLPFFYYPFPDGNVLFSSDIEIIFKVLSQKFEYNWNYLCSYLVCGNSSSIQTPFKNIYELPPACCLKILKNERRTEPFWNPLRSYVKRSPQTRDAVGVLQATLKQWIGPYKNICVSLSGGLDSSSIVYCLKDIIKQDQKLNAINYFHSSVKSSNELNYARKVCQETGIKLSELDVSHSLPFTPSPQNQPLNPNKPFPGLISLKSLESVVDNLPSEESCVFISGHGSDHIMMYPPSKKSVSDYILENGLKGSKKQINNVTQFYRDSFFSIIKENIMSLGSHFFSRSFGKRHPKNTHYETPVWIKQEVHQKASADFAHPIYDHLSPRILPGKYDQIHSLYEGIASIHMEMNPINPSYYPFLSEPVVEFALSFPTYDLFDKGYDRYPLRKAVSDHFETDTVWRRYKSQTSGVFQLGVKKNLEYVKGICLEGQFVKQGLIDRDELHETIMLISNGDINNMWPFMHLASVEIFLKYWDDKFLGET